MSVVQLQPKLVKKDFPYLKIIPLYGRSERFELNRTRYKFHGKFEGSVRRKSCDFELPALKGEEFLYELWVEKQYRLKSCYDSPFILNGQKCFDAYLNEGDRIWMAGNELIFNTEKASVSEPFLNGKRVEQVTQTNLPVIIEGETGSGKSSLARRIHQNGPRARYEFVALNIAALSHSLLESELFGHVKGAFTGATTEKLGAIRSAHRGTLFLDEIDSLPKDIQLKLLLFLDSSTIKPVGSDRWIKCDVRLVFASGQKWKGLLQKDILRKDFFYRLNTSFRISLDSLREKPELIDHCLQQFSQKRSVQVSRRLSEYYRRYGWPGNFRELQGHLEKKYLLSKERLLDLDEIDEDLYASVDTELESVLNDGMTFEQMKQFYFKHIFYRHFRDYKKTSISLGVSERTVRNCLTAEKPHLMLAS